MKQVAAQGLGVQECRCVSAWLWQRELLRILEGRLFEWVLALIYVALSGRVFSQSCSFNVIVVRLASASKCSRCVSLVFGRA